MPGMNREIEYCWQGDLSGAELVALTESHGGTAAAGWWDRIRPHSLGWVTARLPAGDLVGFANVAWDGGDHAFLLDPKVRADLHREGIGTRLVQVATEHARRAGCEWLHVDYEEPLASFYVGACGFRPTPAGLVHLYEAASS